MFFRRLFVCVLALCCVLCCCSFAFAADASPLPFEDVADVVPGEGEQSVVGGEDSDPVLSAPPSSGGGYLPPDDFFAIVGADFTVMAVQSSANTPITSASGLKGILLNLFGSYDPPIVQLRYQANSNSNYTYVNEIQPDYVWLCSAGIFTVMIYCLFKLGGTLLCRT